MSCTQELGLWSQTIVVTSAEETLFFENTWHAASGVSAINFLAEVRNRMVGAGAALALKPALQLATVRADRPSAGAAITAGSVITADGLTAFQETVSTDGVALFRRGWSARLTSGSYARAETTMRTAYRQCAQLFRPREIEVQPTNATAAVNYVPLTGMVPTVGADKGKLIVALIDNLNANFQWRLAGRAFNDPMARGAWVNLDTGWRTPAAGDSEVNTGGLSLSGLSLSTNHFFELALAWRKDADGSPASRVTLHVVPALTFA